MKQKILIFGTKDTAQLAKFYIENDTKYQHNYIVEAFVVDKQFKDLEVFEGLPVVAFEDVDSIYPPNEHIFFAPMTGVKMNTIRESIYNKIKQKGYTFFSYISSKATNFSTSIGENCFILEDNTIQPFVTIGNNVVLWSGNHIGHHSMIKDNVFFTSHIVLSGHCEVKENCWIGVNATIRDYMTIAPKTLIAMGSLITKSTEENGFYMGNPAKKQEKSSIEVY
jgi:sugar O-acyltransferase (sialic acid O-acetyltransferase NeuD family)